MKKYIRFGEIPTSGKSLNYLKLNKDQRSDITDLVKNGYTPEEAVSFCKDNYADWEYVKESDIFEDGLSVFNANEAGLPIIENIDQAHSLAARIGYTVFCVSGEEIRKGQDKEPLLNISEAEKIEVQASDLVDIIIDFLKKNYVYKSGAADMSRDINSINEFLNSIIYAGVEFQK